MKIKKYSKSETREIMEVFGNNPTYEQKAELAKKLDRTIAQLYQKYNYEKAGGYAADKVRKERQRLAREKRNAGKKPSITVTHLNKNLQYPTIKIGDALVTMTSNSFKIGGVQIEC